MQLDKYEIETEVKLAYQYLEEKGWISIKHSGGTKFDYKITARGIDEIESNKPKSESFM